MLQCSESRRILPDEIFGMDRGTGRPDSDYDSYFSGQLCVSDQACGNAQQPSAAAAVGEGEPGRDPLWHQPVAAELGDQDLGVEGIAFDLLPQPIHVTLKRMGGDIHAVAPDLLK